MAHNNNDSESTVNFTVLPPVSRSGQRLCPSVVVHRILKCTEQLNSFFFLYVLSQTIYSGLRGLLLICDQQDAPR